MHYAICYRELIGYADILHSVNYIHLYAKIMP